MASNRFNELAKASEKKRDILTKRLKKEINSLYKGLYQEIDKKLSKMPQNASKAYVKSLKKELGREIVKINKEILTKTQDAVKEAAKLGVDAQINFFNELSSKYDLRIDKAIWDMCTKIHTDVVAEILGGKIYKDRAGLSERIWLDTKRFKKDIDVILSEGLAQKKGTKEIAKDLEKYVNPKYKDAIYKNVRGQANFNTYRIAHTSIIHAYQQSAKRSSMRNPYVEGIRWVSAHDSRCCPICQERDNQVYSAKDLPLDTLWGVAHLPMNLICH